MADVTVEFGATDTGLDKTLQGIRDSMKNLETQQKTTAMSTDEVERSLRELKKLQGMEKHFMDLSGETKKLSESQIEAERSSQELAAAMKKAEAETRALAEEQKKAESITKANRTATEIYNQEIEELQKHLAAGRISMDTFTAATAKAEKNLSAASPQAKDLGNNITDVGDKTKKIGGIFDDEFKRMGAAFTIGNLAAEGFQKAISLAFDAARAVMRGFSDALDLGGRLSELSARTGEAAGKLLVLETAFKNSGLEASQVGQVINKLQNFMQDAANGGEKQTKVMRDLGITMADLAGKTPSEQMEVFAKNIAAIEDPTQRAATASEVFGEKLGGKLLPLLVDFSGNIEDARSKVGSLEQVMNENADTFDKFSESIDTVNGKVMSFSAGVLSETVSALQDLGSIMEEVNASGLGKFIGQLLVPAIEDLVKTIKLANQVFELFQNSVSTIGGSLKDHSDQFKKAATEANKYLQVIAAFLPSGLDPLNLALKGIANVSDEATNGMNGVADAASDAAPVIDEVADSAQTAGTDIASAFSLNAEFKPQLDSIGDGWKNVGDNIGTSNSLLEGTGDAFGAIAEKTEDQVAGIGGVNEQLTVSQDLNKLILDTTGKIADKEAEAADKAAKKAEEQRKSNDLKQGELKFQLELAEAQAAGDSERVTALQEAKKYADDLKKALDAGFDENEAALFATNMAIAATNSKNIKQYDNDGNPLFYKAAEMSAKLNENLKSATGFADTLAKMKEIEALNKAANSSKAMREELRGMDKLLGTTFAQKSEYDIVKLLNLKNIGTTSQDQIRGIVTYFNGVRDQLSAKPIDSAKGQEEIQKIIKFLGGNPLTADLVVKYQKAQAETKSAFGSIPATLDADKSVKGLRDSVKDGIELDVAAKSGATGLLDAIKTAVEAIKAAVEKIEPKLPQQVLA
jgi:ABC-type transporter Mla subunit MlaD